MTKQQIAEDLLIKYEKALLSKDDFSISIIYTRIKNLGFVIAPISKQ